MFARNIVPRGSAFHHQSATTLRATWRCSHEHVPGGAVRRFIFYKNYGKVVGKLGTSLIAIMHFSFFSLAALYTLFADNILAAPKHPQHTTQDSRRRCTAHDSCWPSLDTWAAFNTSISGRLIASRPSAAVCHDPTYHVELCETAKTNWTNSDWRTDQVGAYSAILWEVGNGQCFPDTPQNDVCDQGLVAPMSVNASSVEDIEAAICFAEKHDLYLTIKNTGHDHLGRSSGDGSLAIWTHNMKGRAWHDSFIPSNAPRNVQGVPAVTLQAGEQWLDVYHDASAHNRIVVGGSARTVGAAGGYLLGGGHSPWSYHYGLAVDNLLEMSIVTPKGKHITINEYSDPEYFWAVRGGGGSAWGVVTSVTYKTHPLPTHISVAFFQANTTSVDAWRQVYAKSLRALPAMTDAGYTGYGSTEVAKLVQFVFLQPNGTDESLQQGTKGFQEMMALNGTNGTTVALGNMTFPSWDAYIQLFLSDPNIGTNIQDASRLLTPEVLKNKAEDLVELAIQYPDVAPGHNFIGKVNPSQRIKTSVHPIWASSRTVMSFGISWPNNATAAEKKRRKQELVKVSLDLGRIVGAEGGTYINEANPYEPDWQNVFWGTNYKKLEAVKRGVDPRGLMVCNRCVGTDVVYEL
ncbi:hypothetical protein Q7P37_000863 [Cladosporium fusiforme]